MVCLTEAIHKKLILKSLPLFCFVLLELILLQERKLKMINTKSNWRQTRRANVTLVKLIVTSQFEYESEQWRVSNSSLCPIGIKTSKPLQYSNFESGDTYDRLFKFNTQLASNRRFRCRTQIIKVDVCLCTNTKEFTHYLAIYFSFTYHLYCVGRLCKSVYCSWIYSYGSKFDYRHNLFGVLNAIILLWQQVILQLP